MIPKTEFRKLYLVGIAQNIQKIYSQLSFLEGGQILISRYPFEDIESDYINAVPVDGFRFKEQFIVTQMPLPNTVQDFWRMINEKSVKVIINLNDIPENDPVCLIKYINFSNIYIL